MYAGKTHALTKVLNDCKQVRCSAVTLRARPARRAEDALEETGDDEGALQLDADVGAAVAAVRTPTPTHLKQLKSRTGLPFDCQDVYSDDCLWTTDDDPLIAPILPKDVCGRVVVDEAQFLTPLQVAQLRELSCRRNLSVHCFGLRADVMNTPFEGSAHLMACAQRLVALRCCCSIQGCRNEAECTINPRMITEAKARVGEKRPAIDVSSDEYKPVCVACWARAVYE